MKILNISIILITMACAVAEVSTLKDYLILKRQDKASECEKIKSVLSYAEEKLIMDHTNLQQHPVYQVAKVEHSQSIAGVDNALDTITSTLTQAKKDGFKIQKSLETLAEDATEFVTKTIEEYHLLPVIGLAIENIGNSFLSFLK
ncbi:hypothetical protein BGW39_009534 [Mortierella sp. 14UC]|nr:hypothetical protein BGW39_009534 [Mortierella sp. 14UC]